MKNFEFWEKEIKKIASYRDSRIALANGKVVPCNGLLCSECDWMRKPCNGERVKWLYEEHVDAPKINIRTKMFFEAIQTGWVARDKDKSIFYYKDKPKKTTSGWMQVEWTNLSRLEFLSLDFIRWEDEEPWKVEDIVKLEVCDE